MFDRAGLKREVRARLKGNWGTPFLVLFVFGVITMLVAYLPMLITVGTAGVQGIFSDDPMEILRAIAVTSPMASLFDLALSILVIIPISVAVSRYFLQFWRGEQPTLGSALDGYSNGRLGRYVAASLWETLWVLVWSIPAIIALMVGAVFFSAGSYGDSNGMTGAGVFLMIVGMGLSILPLVKSYSYIQNAYLIGDHPNLSASQSLNLSKRMMKGHKWELFVLGLSFIPWMLLVSVTFGIASIYVAPYTNTTVAAYHDYIVRQALEKGIVTPAELGMEPNAGPGTPPSSKVGGSGTIDF